MIIQQKTINIMKKILLTGLGILIVCFVSAQSVTPELVSSSGGHYEGSSYQLDWSIGEVAVETYTGTTYTLSQGFHQNTYTVTAVKKLKFDNVEITAYPNPTSDFITIKNSDKLQKDLTVEVADIQGKIYLIEKYTSDKKKVNFAKFSAGMYFLNVKLKGTTIKSFKIIKK